VRHPFFAIFSLDDFTIEPFLCYPRHDWKENFMSSSNAVSFRRNLSGFLGSLRLGRGLMVSRSRGGSSLDPVQPVDAAMAAEFQDHESMERFSGFSGVTRQILAAEVLDSLIHIQSDLSEHPSSDEAQARSATAAYSNALNDLRSL
jgi:hypothetical protein